MWAMQAPEKPDDLTSPKAHRADGPPEQTVRPASWERTAGTIRRGRRVTDLRLRHLLRPGLVSDQLNAIGNTDIPTFRLPKDSAPDTEFSGERMASAASRFKPGQDYWTGLHLYLTVGGKLIFPQLDYTEVEERICVAPC